MLVHSCRMPAFDFSNYSAVLLDFDGTLCHEEHVLPGAVELVAALENAGVPYAVLSNTTLSPRAIAQHLLQLGIAMNDEHIYTAVAAAADYVIQKFPGQPGIFNLTGEGIVELLQDRVRWIESPDELCDAVICGAPANVFATPDRQRIAMRLLRAGANLIGTCADRVYTSPRGIEIGAGALARLLEYSAHVTATFTGKPNKLFFDHLCQRLAVPANECILIGDNLESDVAGAAAMGMKTILPLTGVTSAQDIQRFSTGPRPNWIIRDLTELL